MNDATKQSDHSERRRGLIALLAATALLTAMVSFIARQTADTIAANKAAQEMRTILEVAPVELRSADSSVQATFPEGNLTRRDGLTAGLVAYRVTGPATEAAWVLATTADKAYVEPIRLMVGFSADGMITGVRAVSHRETPGLGDKIDAGKTDWIRQFDGRKLAVDQPSLKLRRDGGQIDHISGATITSRSVANAVNAAAGFYRRHRTELEQGTTKPATN